MTKFKGLIECPYCGKMTITEGDTNIRYISNRCTICNEDFMYRINTLNGVVEDRKEVQ